MRLDSYNAQRTHLPLQVWQLVVRPPTYLAIMTIIGQRSYIIAPMQVMQDSRVTNVLLILLYLFLHNMLSHDGCAPLQWMHGGICTLLLQYCIESMLSCRCQQGALKWLSTQLSQQLLELCARQALAGLRRKGSE